MRGAVLLLMLVLIGSCLSPLMAFAEGREEPGVVVEKEQLQKNLAKARRLFKDQVYEEAWRILLTIREEFSGEDRARLDVLLGVCECQMEQWQRGVFWFRLAATLATSMKLRQRIFRERLECRRLEMLESRGREHAGVVGTASHETARVSNRPAVGLAVKPNPVRGAVATSGLDWEMPTLLEPLPKEVARVLAGGGDKEVEAALGRDVVIVESKSYRIISLLGITPNQTRAIGEELEYLKKQVDARVQREHTKRRVTVVLAVKGQLVRTVFSRGGRFRLGAGFHAGLHDRVLVCVVPELPETQHDGAQQGFADLGDREGLRRGFLVSLLLLDSAKVPHWFLGGNAALLCNMAGLGRGPEEMEMPWPLLEFLENKGVHFASLKELLGYSRREFELETRTITSRRRMVDSDSLIRSAKFSYPRICNRLTAFMVVLYLDQIGLLDEAWKMAESSGKVELSELLGDGYCGFLDFLNRSLGDSLDSAMWKECPMLLENEELP